MVRIEKVPEIPQFMKVSNQSNKKDLVNLVESMMANVFTVLNYFHGHIFAKKSPEDELTEKLKKLLRKTEELQKQEAELKSEREELLRKTVQLQDQVIELQGVQLNRVTETVQSNFRSFSAVVTQNCRTALAPKRIQKAVEKAAASTREDVDRSKNLMVFGLHEGETEDESELKTEVERVLEVLDEKPKIEVKRVGLKRGERERPVIVKLQNRDMLLNLLRKAKQLRQSEKYSRVYLARDMPYADRMERRELQKTVKELREKDPECKIRVRGGAINID